jgi:hypothetical protein
LTDVLLSSPGPGIGQADIARAANRLRKELPVISSCLDESTTLRIDAYHLPIALEAPERLVGAEKAFSPSPSSCRRAIGISAMAQCLRDPTLAPARAVSEVLDLALRSSDESPRRLWWEEWFRRIAPGARAVVQAEAVTWATQLHGALEWSRFDPPARVGGDYRWTLPGSPRLTIHAKIDVYCSVHERPVVFSMLTGLPGPQWSSALSLTALTAAMVQGSKAVPARVVGMWPASGQVRILEVDGGTLDRCSKQVVQASWALARSVRPTIRERSVGRL